MSNDKTTLDPHQQGADGKSNKPSAKKSRLYTADDIFKRLDQLQADLADPQKSLTDLQEKLQNEVDENKKSMLKIRIQHVQNTIDEKQLEIDQLTERLEKIVASKRASINKKREKPREDENEA